MLKECSLSENEVLMGERHW